MIFCVFGFANFLKFEAVTKIYIKDTIYVKCQVTNYDVWFNLMDTIRLFRILVLSLHRSSELAGLKACSGVGITLLKNLIADPAILHFNKQLIMQ